MQGSEEKGERVMQSDCKSRRRALRKEKAKGMSEGEGRWTGTRKKREGNPKKEAGKPRDRRIRCELKQATERSSIRSKDVAVRDRTVTHKSTWSTGFVSACT